PAEFRRHRTALGIEPSYRLVDTCAAEFESYTPYYYSAHDQPFQAKGDGWHGTAANGRAGDMGDDLEPSDKPKVIILGGGPNRIGQGIEFDYCCVHAVQAAREMGFETVMVNSNPETVSTDYDTADLLFFEPLTHDDVLNICQRLGGQRSAISGQPDVRSQGGNSGPRTQDL